MQDRNVGAAIALGILAASGIAVAAASSRPPGSPFVNLGSDRTVGLLGGQAILVLQYETNVTGAQVSKFWTVLSGPAAVNIVDTGAREATMAFTATGEYQIQLNISAQGPGGETAVDTVMVTVVGDEPPPVPVLNLGPDRLIRLDAQGVVALVLDYELSHQGTKVWSVLDGPAAVGITDTGLAQATLLFTLDGNYRIELEVTVPGFAPVRDEILVGVDPPTPPPAPQLNLGPDLVVQLPATGVVETTLNYTANRPLLSKVWNVLAGPAGAQVAITDTGATQVRMQFTVAGDYTIELVAAIADAPGSISDSLIVQVLDPTEPPPGPPDPPPGAVFITGNQPNGITVPAGQHYVIQGHVTTPRSVVVEGKLWLREKFESDLHFTNINNNNFVGGVPAPDTDIGLYIRNNGEIDCQGNFKEAWGYGLTSHPTWLPTDELVEAPLTPTEVTAGGFRPYTRGTTPRLMPDGRRLPVLNLTRGVRIRGEAGRFSHIHIMNTRPSVFKYTEISYMGVPRLDANGNNDGVLGRYGMHFHMCGDGSRNSIVEGVVIKHTGGWGFVPHMSNGITFHKDIIYDAERGGYIWDPGEPTNDNLYDTCVAAWVHEIGTSGRRISGFDLNSGSNNLIRQCASIGIRGSGDAAGYLWGENNSNTGAWDFEDNLALACLRWGSFVWQNTGRLHQVTTAGKFVIINCGQGGLSHGAYSNGYKYRRLEIYNLPGTVGTFHHAVSNGNFAEADGYGQRFEGVMVRGGANAIEIVRHPNPPAIPTLFKDYDIAGLSGRKMVVDDNNTGQQSNALGLYDVVNCGILPADVEIRSAVTGTVIRLQEGTQAWRITSNGNVSSISRFY